MGTISSPLWANLADSAVLGPDNEPHSFQSIFSPFESNLLLQEAIHMNLQLTIPTIIELGCILDYQQQLVDMISYYLFQLYRLLGADKLHSTASTIINMTTIAAGPPSVAKMLPCLTNISQITASLSNFQFHFLQSLSKCRNFLSVLQEERKQQMQMTVDLCQRMDSLMNSRLSPPKQPMKSSQPAKTEVIQRSFSPVDRLNSKQKAFDEKTDKKKVKKASKVQKQVQIKEVVVLQKDSETQLLQVYGCLLCLRDKKTPFLWGETAPYLDHIRQVHQIEPQFQILVSGSKYLSFTHVFFQGTLTRTTPIDRQYGCGYELYLIVLYLFQEHRFDQLFVCGCLQMNALKSFRNGSPLLLSASDFANHVSRKHNNIEQAGSTHSLSVKNEHTRVMRAISSQTCFKTGNIVEVIQQIRERLQKYYRKLRYVNLLRQTPGSNELKLQIISTLPANNQNHQYFHPIPYCPACKLYFGGIKDHLNHKIKIHQNKDNCQIAEYGVGQMLDYLEHKGSKFDQQNSFTSTLTKQQNRLLNLQMYLIQSKVKSCGDCSLLFPDQNSESFLLHLYQAHGGQCSKASHKFSFLKGNCTSEEPEEDQEISEQ